ncbi:MAG TPA: DUF2027 domain-containing protein, partial [Bacteroidales bacterium]|nr:DUF2027 domain-containing protein [Bacteroidales bacterium]
MKFKIGDKVKFLNEKGEGIVTKIISYNMVGVSIEEGFEIPTLVSDILLLESNNNSLDILDNTYNSNLVENTLIDKSVSDKIKKGIYFAFVPNNQKLLITGIIDIYLINNENDIILYNIFLKTNNNFEGVAYGSALPNSKTLIASEKRDNFNKWLKGIIQIIYHPLKSNEPPLPIHMPYSINHLKFLNENNYKPSVFFNEKVITYCIIETQSFTTQNEELLQKFDLINKYKVKNDDDDKENFLIDSHKIEDGIAEVDLHIEKLTDNIKNLTAHQKLLIQIDYFNRCLDSAIAAKYDKVIFIHGIGQGILKKEIEKYLEKIKGLEYYDAPISKYGYGGATEVVLHHNLL